MDNVYTKPLICCVQKVVFVNQGIFQGATASASASLEVSAFVLVQGARRVAAHVLKLVIHSKLVFSSVNVTSLLSLCLICDGISPSSGL